ncbi:MAG: choice-of-anchor I family protein [Flammeovirgaceae bacterium]
MTRFSTKLLLLLALTVGFTACDDDEPISTTEDPASFKRVAEIDLGGEGASEIAAFDPSTNKLFVVNNESDSKIDVVDLSDPTSIPSATNFTVAGGGVNSVAVSNGLLAVAVEAEDKQANGTVVILNTTTLAEEATVTVGALPDMVTFTPDGSMILVANEGEPNDDYDNDPDGSVSVITVSGFAVTTLDFTSFNGSEATLEAAGFRVFGPGADLAADVEPEYITVSDDSQTAWVALQENNGIAKINLSTKTITDIFPLGFKDHSLSENAIDASNEDDKVEFNTWPVLGMYQPDAIESFNVNGTNYIISANEGDAREYDGFEEEDRIGDVDLDPTAFPDAATLQDDAMLGRLKLTLTLGDTDGDGDFDKLYSYGARSFSIWNGDNGSLVYDSGNDLEEALYAAFPNRYDDGRSDDKGVEPEGVAIGQIGNQTIAFIGLERADAVVTYDVTNPNAPVFMQVLEVGDAPEGIFFVDAADSPNGRAILIVSSEDDGVVKVFQTALTL